MNLCIVGSKNLPHRALAVFSNHAKAEAFANKKGSYIKKVSENKCRKGDRVTVCSIVIVKGKSKGLPTFMNVEDKRFPIKECQLDLKRVRLVKQRLKVR